MPAVLPPDVMLMICECAANSRDFATLFNCVRSGKQLAGSALLWLYRIHTQASIRGGESNEDEMSRTGGYKATTIDARVAQQRRTVSQWASQWRSIILSSIGKTVYPYCLYIQSLDLRNLEDLLDDSIFRDHFQTDFFAGDMTPFSSIRQIPNVTRTHAKRQRQLQRANIPVVVKAVGESISTFVANSATISGTTAALEDLSGNIPADVLPQWTARLSRLTSMTLWDGAVLNGHIGQVIKDNCRNFSSLNVYHCIGDKVDVDLASFFTTLPCNTMRSVRVFSRNDIGTATFEALTGHKKSLTDLVLGNLKASALRALSSLQELLALRNLDLTDVEHVALGDAHALAGIINWIGNCEQLKSLRLRHFIDGPAIMKSVCLQDRIRLQSLTVSGYTLRNSRDFHQSLSHQTSLEAVELRADPEDCTSEDIDVLVSSLCMLNQLKYLNLLDTSDSFEGRQIHQLAFSLSKLEDVSISGFNMGDEIWPAILQLLNLKSISFHAITSFTFEGIMRYILQLQPSNAGLLLSVMSASIESELSASEQATIKDAIEKTVDGKFEFVLYREAESESDSDSN